MLYNVVLVSAVQQNESVISIHTSHFLFKFSSHLDHFSTLRQVPCAAAAAAAKSLQSCPPLCNPIDGSPAGPAVPGILQARILEWVAISFSSACK